MSEIKVSKLTNRAGTGAPDFSQGVKISGSDSGLLAPTRTEEELIASSDWTVSLSDVSYDSVSFSVASQTGNPTGAVFNHDGTKIYVISPADDAIFQYGLSTAYDLSTASYDNKSFSVLTQESTAYGLTVNSDTTKVYITGINTDYIYEYDLSTASDISTASYNSVSLDISSQDGNSRAITFNNDGTKLFMCGASSDSVHQYNLTTAYDLSTASYASSSFDVSSQTAAPIGLKFNPDGTQMFIIGNSQYVYQYSLTTGYNLSTASYDSVTFYTNAFETGPQDIFFSADGTKMFIPGNVLDNIYQLSTGATAPASEPENPANGDTWWNTADDTYSVYINNEWKQLIGSVSVWYGDRGIVANTYTTAATNIIEYYDITTTGNASDFGDTTVSKSRRGACSDGSRGLIAGGQSPTTNVIDYISISTAGNSSDFGDLTAARDWLTGCSDGTYGLFAGGTVSTNTIDYVTVQTAANAADFGDLTTGRWQPSAWSDATYGVFCGGNYNYSNVIDYVTIASPGNATDFGDLIQGRYGHASCGDTTRTLIGGGQTASYLNSIEYITTATAGNGTDFGDLLAGNSGVSACSNATYGCWNGGEVSGNTIQYVTVQTTGNASDFGDLVNTGYGATALSG